MNDPRGSLWRRWDLHVHTPASLHHHYGAGPDVWERFISALEGLPKDFSVIGINDYMFLDGYRKVLEFKNQRRLKNIHTFLPVLEFRLAKFAGTDGHLRRINYHVIFSNALTTDQIEQQFLSQLSASYSLTPGIRADWSGVVTRDSLTDLGRKIVASAPESKRGEFGPPIVEGFNNLNLTIEAIQAALRSSYFKDNYITAIGKTEWSSLKWNDQSIAEKKTLINGADVVFIASDNASAYHKARSSLREQEVNDKLLDCSDAHHWPDSGDKDSIGRCDLWVKADPTFRGLQHALYEFNERVYVGTEPPKVADVKRWPQRYIQSVAIRKVPASTLKERWFDSTVPLNPGLVAIIGNKGSGKSALADILALGGNSLQQPSFSFLQPDKFRNPRDDKSLHFEATLTWQSGDSHNYKLSDSCDPEDVERVRYIPQSYLERLCNEFASEGGGAFDSELRAVIFSHIPNAERLGKQTLGALLGYLGEETYDRINNLKGDLSKVNREIAALEEAASQENRRELEKRHTAKLKELSILKGNEPKPVPKPDADPATVAAVEALQARIDAHRATVSDLERQVEGAQQLRRDLLAKIATADKVLQRVRNLDESHRQLERESEEDLASLGLVWTELVTFAVDVSKLKELHSRFTTEEAAAKGQLDDADEKSPLSRLSAAKEEITALQNQLDAPTRRHQEYLTALKEWKDSVAKLEGDAEDPNSVASIAAALKRLSEIPGQLVTLEEERLGVTRAIFQQIAGLKEHYRQLYRPVQDFIQKHRALAESIRLSFDVRISEKSLASELSDWINKGRAGSFQGAEEGAARIKEIVRRNSFDTPEGVVAFLSEFVRAVRNDVRQPAPRPMSISAQLKANRPVEAFYDFIFGLGYLEPRYALKMEGKELIELSPGERGLLLLLFYLLVERSEAPLILDQPEENLDNETVHHVLVPSIQLAKHRRQIVIVTHNPNLAVVADADR